MLVSELQSAVLRLSAVSRRHGAQKEAWALQELARIIEPHASKSVADMLKQLKPRAIAGRRRRKKVA